MKATQWMTRGFVNNASVWWGEAPDEPAREYARPTESGRMHRCLLFLFGMLITACNAFGLGADYPKDFQFSGTNWPASMNELVNRTNRVHAFFVNAEDIFFFSGRATNFSEFLRDYAKIADIEKHRLILHEGIGEAKSPWSKAGQPCDWKLYGCPAQWHNFHNAVKASRYLLEVHFWMGGRVALEQVAVPGSIEFAGSYFKAFDSITNGMTRAEVEARLTLDGGLQGASPVRFFHPSCPRFKVRVEFDFKRNAADQNRAVIGRDDKVVRVSAPYLERPFND
jgi:hypothetical protein